MWLLLAAGEFEIVVDEPAGGGSLMLFELVASMMSTLYFVFLIWMLIHCYRTEPDRFFWIWIMLIIQPFGAIGYFVIRYLPSREYGELTFLRRWTRGPQLARLETAARQIGNSHQYVQWGNALREVGNLSRANEAYAQALKKDPQDLQALWGSAQIATAQKRYQDVRSFTRAILDKDPQYKFGDVSLENGRALKELGERDEARTQFEWHIRRWRHPEAMYLLAELYAENGQASEARNLLSSLIMDINGSPTSIARKHGRWKSRARQLLRKLG
ncbi:MULTISPECIES: tetratricopeptide repeat protein [unclassified Schlesneria]|uniref:tetratricopeptide repeat protein n=1 Tax=Schlesneria TaxID=656899 RepID=UPI002EEC65AE